MPIDDRLQDGRGDSSLIFEIRDERNASASEIEQKCRRETQAGIVKLVAFTKFSRMQKWNEGCYEDGLPAIVQIHPFRLGGQITSGGWGISSPDSIGERLLCQTRLTCLTKS